MNRANIKGLLLGENDSTLVNLREFLEKRGCDCSFSKSPDESLAAFGRRSFDLILNTLPMRTHPSLPELGTPTRNIFSSYPVENGCWWLPIMRGGRACFGTFALRPNELAGTLQDALRGIQDIPNGPYIRYARSSGISSARHNATQPLLEPAKEARSVAAH
jgi:hypothetical protein